MKLGDLYQDLSHGELSNLHLSGEGDGTIAPNRQGKLLLYTNDGLLRLFSRFVLKENDVLVHLHQEITFYHLLPRFAVNYQPTGEEDNEPIRYLTDLPSERFKGDVIKILQVYDSKGCRLPLNDVENIFSVFTPQSNVLQVVAPVADTVLSVQYQARHVKLTGDLEEEIVLPDVLYDPLRAFVSYRVFSDMNTQDSSSKAQEHLANYESMCNSVREGDLVGTSISTSNTRFHARGWI
jgi:hypothetical protein